MKVLIIEDEPFAQQELKRLLDGLNKDIEILDMIDTVEDAVEWLNTRKAPDLIFLDIQLADGLSFEIFKKAEVNVPVIFTTAYDEFAVRAFQLNSIDYLLKPIKQDDLARALNKLDSMKSQFSKNNDPGIKLSKQQLESLIGTSKKEYKSRFVAKVGDQIKHVSVADIAYFYAEDNVVFLMTSGNSRFIIDYSIEEIDKMLDPKVFYRLNRAFVVNINAIDKVYKYLNSRLKIELKPPTEKEVLVSRAKVASFMEWMER
jgi:DNA-binding LytR/AlgR family response regulator